MGLNRRIALGVAASYVGKAVQIVLNLALVPLLFRHLSEEVVGQASIFLGLLDFGFGPTLTRRIAFAKGSSGAHVDVELTAASREKLGDLICTGKVIYRWLALVILIVAGTTGMVLLKNVRLVHLSYHEVLVAWALFCLSYAINTWGGLWSVLLGGLGFVGSASMIGVVVQAIALVVKIVAVVMGGGLLHLALIECVAGIANRQVTLAYLRWKDPQLFRWEGAWSTAEFRSLLNPAVRYWLTSLGAFLILQTDQFFIARYLGIAEIADYRAAYLVIANLNYLALTLSLISNPFYSQLWQAGHLPTFHSVLMRNLSVGLGIMLSGLLAAGCSSPSLFNLWLGPGHFIGFPILLVFSAMMLLETQHGFFAAAARSTEDEVYAPWALGAGLLNLLLTWLLVRRIGLLGVALGTFLAQLMTNNWFCVVHGLKQTKLSFHTYASRVLYPLMFLALITFLPIVAALNAVPSLYRNDWLRLITVSLWCGITLLIYLWNCALTVEERVLLMKKIKLAVSFELGS
jgi:O-antigen/teichoic acid export membrane protein